MKFAFIGYGTHAKRIEKILKNHNELFSTYSLKRNWNCSDIIQDTKAVFITSPNSTHLNNIKKIQNIDREIFIYCEKPIVKKVYRY